MASKTRRIRQRDFQVRKNLLDIEHQRWLNYFNVSSVAAFSVGFTAVWAYLLGQVSFELGFSALLVNCIFFGVAVFVCLKRMGNAAVEIGALA